MLSSRGGTHPHERGLGIFHQRIESRHCSFHLGGPVVGLAWSWEVDDNGPIYEPSLVVV